MLTDNDLKSYIKSYYLDRKMTYTKLDKHDRAIGVLLEENKKLKERINDAIDYINKNKQIENTYKCSVDGITREFNTYELYCEPSELLEILGDKEK